jgi:hypothetical protein
MSRQPEAKEFFSGSLFASGLIKPSRGCFAAPPKLVIVEGRGESAGYCLKDENSAWPSKFACFVKVRTSEMPNLQRRQVNLLSVEQISRSK